jgi:uncharacterized protein (TIGR02118 family)
MSFFMIARQPCWQGDEAVRESRMIKRMSILTRKAGVSPERFNVHWSTIHADILKRVWPEAKGYVQNSWNGPGANDIRPPGPHTLDGVVQLWFANQMDLEAAVGSSRGSELFADGALFIEGVTTFLVEERVAKAGPRGAVKRLSLIRAKPGVSPTEFRRHWFEDHPAHVAQGLPRATRYVQNLVIDAKHSHVLASGHHAVDGFVEIWWEDTAAMAADMAGPGVAQMKAHADLFIGDLSSSLVDERVVIDPLAAGRPA